MNNTIIVGIVQARMTSSRLPGKVLKDIAGQPMLSILFSRLSKSKLIDETILATTDNDTDDGVALLAQKHGVKVYRGSENDVLDRFYQAVALVPNATHIVRLTADCPLMDAHVIDSIIQKALDEGVDYTSNTMNPTFPDGLDVEVVTVKALKDAWQNATMKSDREHVTPYIWRNSSAKGGSLFTSFSFEQANSTSHLRLTVDEASDLDLIIKLVERIGPDAPFMEYVTMLGNESELRGMNAHIGRNEGLVKSQVAQTELRKVTNFAKSDHYRSKIHNLIPGGAHTYSKGDDQFPVRSPAAIVRGEGAHLWDLDGNKFLDCSMGLTSVSLGHAYKPVVERVAETLRNGVNFQRPSFLEMETAERFLSKVPGHSMIKFAKNGSTVTTAATKLARAYTGRKLIAIPIDHPFYSYDDWFIGKTACSKGIPEEISALTVSYQSGNLETLKDLFAQYPDQISCVISEPERNNDFNNYPLGELIKITHDNGALFIQDEMITGYKTAYPGTMTKYPDLKPDMATWGKGIANGFAFCALTGIPEVMELGGIRAKGQEKVFLISTTHGAETHALAASLATMDVFENEDVIGHNHSIGDYFIDSVGQVLDGSGLKQYLEVVPTNWMAGILCRDKDGLVSNPLRSVLMQELISQGVLFQGIFVPCFSHTKEDVDYFASALYKSLAPYGIAIENGVAEVLVGPPVEGVFRKYL